MASVINTNLASLYAQKNLSGAQSALSTAVERLSSGLRINRAKDDAAGLGISENIRTQINSVNQGIRNANDAISMVQTAEGALSEVSSILQRMKELSVQARNDSLSTVQRTSISDELVALKNEINSIAERTTFNDISLAKNGLRTAVSAAATGSNALRNGASILSDLTVSGLVTKNVNAGTYTLSTATSAPLANQLSDASNKFGGSEVDTITLGGAWVIGDTIESNVTINGNTTVSATYTVTSQDITAGPGSAADGTGNDAATRDSIASGMAYQLNKAAQAAGELLSFSAKDGVVYAATTSGDAVITTTATVVGTDKNNKATATVGTGSLSESIRYVDINANDAAEGNKFVLSINGREYSVVAQSGATAAAIRNQVASDFTQILTAAYPGSGRVNQVDNVTSDDTGQIALAASLGLGVADISLKVYELVEGQAVTDQASVVSAASTTTAATARTITLDSFDVQAGRKATVTIGDPNAQTTFSVVMGLNDTAATVADRLATLINDEHGNTSDASGVITIASSANFGMYDISLTFDDMAEGALLSSRSSVSAKNQANVARSVTINQRDMVIGNVVSITVDGKEYATTVQSNDVAETVAARLTSMLDDDFSRTVGTVTTPTLSTEVNGTAGGTTGSLETATITFASLQAGDTLAFAGVTMTALADMTATQVATAWGGSTHAAGAVFTDTSLADFSGTLTGGWGFGTSVGTTILATNTFTPAAGANVTDLTNGGTASVASIVTVDGVTAGAASQYESQTFTFSAMAAGDSVSVGGLTFTASRDITQAEAAAAFGSLAAGAKSGNGADYGVYTGSLSTGWAAGTADSTSVAFTANTYGNKPDNSLAVSSQRIDTGVSATAYKATFGTLGASGTVRFGNLALSTAAGTTLSGSQVAGYFASLMNGDSITTSAASGVTWNYVDTTYADYTGGFTTGVASGDTLTFTSENPFDSAPTFVTTAGSATVTLTNSNVIRFGQGTGLGMADISISVKSMSDPGKFTLTANSDTGIGGASQTVDMGTISAGGTKTMIFDQLGVSFTLNNNRDVSVGSADFEVYSSAVNTLTVDAADSGSALFQVGASTRDVVSIDGFKDIRLTGYNKNSDEEAAVFDRLYATLNTIAANTTESLSSENFAILESQIEEVITTVADFRSYFGAQQNRIEFAISNLQAQSENLTAANSRIRDTDYAAETATLTKTQIMQQAATAMLAQANQMPNVILALLK